MIEALAIPGRFEASNQWVSSQTRKPLHWFALLGFGATIFAGMQSPVFLYAGLIIFLLATSIPVIWRNKEVLMICLFVAVICAFVPFLAPIAILLMIVLYIKRILLVLANWRPIVAGLIAYGVPLVMFNNGGGFLNLTTQLIVCVCSMVGIHALLRWQYRWSYDVSTALSLMGIVPLLILAFILPFLKLHIGFDAHDVSVDTHPIPALDAHAASDFHSLPALSDAQGVSTIVEAQAASALANNNTDYAFLHPGIGSLSTDLQHVDSASVPPGYHIVHEHLQTDPDGIEANNFSHPGGPTDDAPPPPGVHIVREYVRADPTS